MGQTFNSPRARGRGLKLFIVAAVLFSAVALLLFFVYRKLTEKPPPTVAGWRATVKTLAGDGSPGAGDAAAATGARFGEPFGVAVGRDGSIYVADAGESNRIRKITPEGAVSTLAGGAEGYADGAGAAARFHTPSALAVDDEGNLYVADTGNQRVRKVTKEGVVTTLAGDGTAGFRDGPAHAAQFNAPVGVAVDREGRVFVADTYNDRIRVVTKEGEVKTVAGAGVPGYADGDALSAALFDTPCGVAVNEAGELFIADTGNDRLRKLTKEGQVITLTLGAPPGETPEEASNPLGLALTHDGFLYFTELDRGRVRQLAPDGTARVIAGRGTGFGEGDGREAARFNQPAGVTVEPRTGSLLVADSANYLVRRVSAVGQEGESDSSVKQDDESAASVAQGANARPAPTPPLPRIEVESIGGGKPFPWPLDPQLQRHEVVATLGEVRGSYDTDDSRHHLHSGLDVFGVYGQTVRAVHEEKVSGPLPNWGFGGLNEGVRVGLFSYIHLRVGRDERDEMLKDSPFIAVRDGEGKLARVRLRRGTRVRVGDALGTVNRMYHVHMNLGPPGAEVNPLALPFAGLTDAVAPKIERDGIHLFNEAGERLKEMKEGRLVLRGAVRVVVDAYDQVDGNQSRRRLGLYRLGFQLLRPDGSPAPGFERPRVQLEFDRLPPDQDATKIAYADESGITVYGSKTTRFLYELTNTVRGGRAERGVWQTSELPPGDYTLRIHAADYAGNEATEGTDVPVTVARD
ncbi:MAG TPA: NHL repeat-containing protein [Pyrinomonadaceae bacterium]|nr:NHL repeat-containing protein [Pyrinomonadaceae bacterium]